MGRLTFPKLSYDVEGLTLECNGSNMIICNSRIHFGLRKLLLRDISIQRNVSSFGMQCFNGFKQ